MKTFSLWFLLLGLFLLCTDALGDDKEEAKERYFKGKALVEEGAYEKAIVELETSYKLNPVPIVLYNIAYCYDELQQYAEAVKYYKLYYSRAEDPPEDLKEGVPRRIKELSKFIGFLELDIDVEGAEIIINQKSMGHTPIDVIPIETGKFDLIVKKQGYKDIKKQITIVSDKTTRISLVMEETDGGLEGKVKTKKERKKKEKKKLKPSAFWTMLVLTNAAGVAALTMGLLAVKADNKVGKTFYEDEDWKDVTNERDRLALATDVLIGITAASTITTLVLGLFTEFKKEKQAGLFFTPDLRSRAISAGYRGVF